MATMNLQQALAQAVAYHQAGRLGEAETLYRQILAQQPNNADALHFLGVLARQAGRNDAAVDLIGKAIALAPNWPDAHNNLGNALSGLGKSEEAMAAYRRAITLRPGYAEAHGNLANVLKEVRRFDEAIAEYQRAITLRPNYPEAYSNMSVVLKDMGRLDEAIAAGRTAIAQRPDYAEAYNNLGIALKNNKQLDEAIALLNRALAIRPNMAETHCNLGQALKEKGQLDQAIDCLRRAAALNPKWADAHLNLGNALRDKGERDAAIAEYRRAIALNPNYSEAHNNLSVALREQDRLDEAVAAARTAIALKPEYVEALANLGLALMANGQLAEAKIAYERAIALRPDYPNGHFDLAMLLLLRGEYLRGWAEYEWRWRVNTFLSPSRGLTQPAWDGSDLTGKTLLIHTEQGFGDTLQFVRYVPIVARRCARLIVMCPDEQIRLLHSVPGAAHWIKETDPMPAFDAQCPLLSLPHACGTILETVPNTVPYLRADPQAVAHWHERMGDANGGLKVGIAWAGRSTHTNDRNRSITLAALVPLAAINGVNFYSLQKGDASQQAKNPPAGMKLINWTDELNDFADTASLVANLDLVIAVDTSVVHLAGAMAIPVWTMLPFAPDWRWLVARDDSPWYPTMRLFRQPKIGDWQNVIGRVAEALKGMVIQRTTGVPPAPAGL